MSHDIEKPQAAAERKVPAPGLLLTIAAVVEAVTGLAFLLTPGPAVALILGAEPDGVGLMIGRIFGVALLSIGIACWGARTDPGGAARSGTLSAITLYNAGTGFLLFAFAGAGKAFGGMVWIVGAVHLVLAALFAASRPLRTGA